MSRPLACELEHPRARIDRGDVRARALCDVVRELALAAADVQHQLALLDAVDEEVVVAREPMLRVHSLVVIDRTEVDAHISVLVDLEELAHRLPVVALRADRTEPESEERPPDGIGEEHAKGAQRHAAADATSESAQRPRPLRHDR